MIRFVLGDATIPEETGGPRLIVHVCNNCGLWGAGFTRALSDRWSLPERIFRERTELARGSPPLGSVQVARIDWDETERQHMLAVVNMIAQDGVRSAARPSPINYEALGMCLASVRALALLTTPAASVHMPRIGCGLAGGKWGPVFRIIKGALVDPGIDVVVYDRPGDDAHEWRKR